jgi:hypothetical protein
MSGYHQEVLGIAQKLAAAVTAPRTGEGNPSPAFVHLLDAAAQAAKSLVDATEVDLKLPAGPAPAARPLAGIPAQPAFPQVGDVVLFVLPATDLRCGNPRAAMVVGVPATYKSDGEQYRPTEDPYLVNLQVFYDGQKVEFIPNVPYSSEKGLGTWHPRGTV